MALRMASDHPVRSADRFTGGLEAPPRPRQARPADLVRCAHRRQYADGILESAGCNVGLLLAQRRSAMEPGVDLQGHGGLHGHSGVGPDPAAVVPADRPVAAECCEVRKIDSLLSSAVPDSKKGG